MGKNFFNTGMQVNMPKTLHSAGKILTKEYVKDTYFTENQTINFCFDDRAHDGTIEKGYN